MLTSRLQSHPMLKYKHILNKIYGNNFIKQHSETVMVWNYQNADCSLKNNFIVLFIIVFGTLSFPVFQQKSAVVFLAHRETPSFIGSGLRPPPNSPGFTPVDYKLCGIVQEECIERQHAMWTIWSNAWLTPGLGCSNQPSTKPPVTQTAQGTRESRRKTLNC